MQLKYGGILIKQKLKKILVEAVKNTGNIDINMEDVEVKSSKSKQYGDFSTNLVMKISKKLNMKPYELGNQIRENILKKYDFFRDIKIEGPGFINFYIKEEYLIKEMLESIEKGDFKRFDNISKNIKLCIALDNINEILQLSEFRSFMNMYYLGNIYDLAGHNVSKIIVVNNDIKTMDTSYFLSNFKNFEITKDEKKLEDSIVFCSSRNQWLFKNIKEKERYVVDKVKVFKNRIENIDLSTTELIDEIGFDRFKYTICTKPLNSEVDIEISKDELKIIQYPYSRISSVKNILEKEGLYINNIEELKEINLDNDLEKDIIKKLTEFKAAVETSINSNDPYKFIKYTNDLCESFYNLNRVTLFRKVEDVKLVSLLKLLESVKIVLGEILKLLELPILEKM